VCRRVAEEVLRVSTVQYCTVQYMYTVPFPDDVGK
jgi:hypothetical protein